MGKTALVLSGGGAKGAFQVGAERYCREVKGYDWDIITGVSVGALNGAILAMREYDRALEFWKRVTPKVVFGSTDKFSVMRRMVMTKKSMFPLRNLMAIINSEIDPKRMKVDFRVSAVSLVTGESRVFGPKDDEFMLALLASAAMPVFFPPVTVSGTMPAMVDGAIRSMAPIGTVLRDDPDEIVIINCNPRRPKPIARTPTSLFEITQRTFDIMTNEIFENDVGKFIRMNRLVEQAEAGGVVLRNTDGTPFRRYHHVIIEPEEALGDTMDFSQKHVRENLDIGWERAKAVLG